MHKIQLDWHRLGIFRAWSPQQKQQVKQYPSCFFLGGRGFGLCSAGVHSWESGGREKSTGDKPAGLLGAGGDRLNSYAASICNRSSDTGAVEVTSRSSNASAAHSQAHVTPA